MIILRFGVKLLLGLVSLTRAGDNYKISYRSIFSLYLASVRTPIFPPPPPATPYIGLQPHAVNHATMCLLFSGQYKVPRVLRGCRHHDLRPH